MKIPVRSGAKLDAGDRIELVGLPQDVRRAAAQLGFSDPVKTESSVPLLGLGICLGGLIFRMDAGGQDRGDSLSLTVSGGVLLAGLFLRLGPFAAPDFGRHSRTDRWFMNNMGLNTFIAIVGISTGPSFVAGFQQVGWSLFLVGAGATTLSSGAGRVDRPLPVPFQRCPDARMRRWSANDYGGSRCCRGYDRQQCPLAGIYHHLCHR